MGLFRYAWLLATIAVLILLITLGVVLIGLPTNSQEYADLATQVALAVTPAPQPTTNAVAPGITLDTRDRLALQRDLIQNAADNRMKTWTLLAQMIRRNGPWHWRLLHKAQHTCRPGRPDHQ